jgi:hypothetical protein
MLLPDQRIQLIWEGRSSVLQQGWPGREFKRGELNAGIEADSPTIAKLEMVGAAITNLGRKRQMEPTLTIALQPLRNRAVDQQQQILTRRTPAVNPGALEGMEPTTATPTR